MRRRTLLRAILGLTAVLALPLSVGRSADAAVVGGSGSAKLWQWVALPDSGGLQIHCTSARPNAPTSVRVSWTAAGVVTATFPQGPLSATAGNVTMGPGIGLAVRRVGS